MGFHLIADNNGWAMAFTGATIVMIGLSGLALIISQLHKVLALFESKKQGIPFETAGETPAPAVEVVDWLADPAAAARMCQLFTAHMGDAFTLNALYQEVERSGCPHPHLTVRTWREEGLLVPCEHGRFCWKQVS